MSTDQSFDPVREAIVKSVGWSGVLATAFLLGLAGSARAEASKIVSIDSLRALARTGQFEPLESVARASLKELETTRAPDSTIGRTIDLLVQSFWQRGLTGGPEIEKLAERAVLLKQRAYGPEHPQVAQSVHNLAILASVGGDFPTARARFERAKAIYEKALGPDHPKVAEPLMGLANVASDTGDFPGAIRAYERVIAIWEKAYGLEGDRVGAAVFNLGNVYSDTRNYAAARPLYERAKAIWEKLYGPDSPQAARAVGALAAGLLETGEPEAAQRMFEHVLAIEEGAYGPDSPNVSRTLNNLGMALIRRGDYNGARPRFERSLAIAEKAYGPEHPLVAEGLASLGYLDRLAGDHAAARPLYERALAIREKTMGVETTDAANTRMDLGTLLKMMGEVDSALVLCKHALATTQKVLGPDNLFVAEAWSSLGNVLEAKPDLPAAKEAHLHALAIREKVLGPEHESVALSLEQLSDVYVVLGDTEEARKAAERSLAIREKVLGPDHPNLGRSLIRLAWAEAVAGDNAHALDHALATEHVSLDHLRLTSRALSERQALEYAGSRSNGLDLAMTIVARGVDGASRRRAFDALVRSRAAVLDEMASRHRAVGDTSNAKLVQLAAELTSARTRLANLVVRGEGNNEPAAYRKLVDDAREAREKAERAMADASADFVRENARSRAGFDDVRASLPAGTAILAYTEYSKSDPTPRHLESTAAVPSYLAFVLRAGDSEPRVFDLGAAADMDARVVAWKQAASGVGRLGQRLDLSEAGYREGGTALRARMFDPVAAALQGVHRVFVVPDGALNLVNVAALPDEGKGYLVEREPAFHYVSAERDLVPAGQVTRGRDLLAVGAPDFDAAEPVAWAAANIETGGKHSTPLPALAAAAATSDGYRGPRSSCGDLAGMRFEPLAATGEETLEIGRMWEKRSGRGTARGGVLDLRGAMANETAFKQAAPGRRVLHVATHGFFLGTGCGPSSPAGRGIGSLAEDPGSKMAALSSSTSSESPLLRSGLVFAGANHRSETNDHEDDGVLTAEEIASLDLSHAEWAVLSACETGVGDVRAGEGVFGLRRAFEVAGAGTLILSLWSVDDEATRAWMKALYEGRLKKQLDTADAVRGASLEILRERRAHKQSTHPFYWAAFVATGDWH